MVFFFFFFKQKTAYEMRISDWSSDVCSSDLQRSLGGHRRGEAHGAGDGIAERGARVQLAFELPGAGLDFPDTGFDGRVVFLQSGIQFDCGRGGGQRDRRGDRSEEHTSELQSLMRISYAVFCLKKKNNSLRSAVSVTTEHVQRQECQQ